MPPLQNLTLAVSERIATLSINRPDKLNALNDETMREIGLAITEARTRDDVGGVIFTGTGRAFVAGADIAEIATQAQDALRARDRSRTGQEIFRRIEQSPKPVIAAVNGFALGGGCELAMACHIRIASDQAKFGQPEVKLGIGPGYGGTQRLPRLIGRSRALQLLLTGETIDATEALRIGLVNKVVPAAELMPAARAMMLQILSNGPLAVAVCIETVDRGLQMTLEDGLVLEANQFGLLAATKDMEEGTRAFLEKRPPSFAGR